MTLSFKVAMLTSLMFIGGMCWLVNQVARPSVAAFAGVGTADTGSPVVSRSETSPPPSPLDRRNTSPVTAAQGLQRKAPVEQSIATAPPPKPIDEPVVAHRDPLPPVGDPPHANITEPVRSAPATPDEPLVASRGTRGPSATPNPVSGPTGSMPRGTLVAQNKSEPNIFDQAKPERMPEPPVARPEPTNSGRDYVVKKGDTLERIARRELKSTDAATMAMFASLNPDIAKRKGHAVRLGERLTLPDLAKAPEASPKAESVAKVAATPKTEPPVVASSTKTGASKGAAAPTKAVRAGKNDTKTRVASANVKSGSAKGKPAAREVAATKSPSPNATKVARRNETSPQTKHAPVAKADRGTDKRETPAPSNSRKSTAKDAVATERKALDKVASAKGTGKPGEKSKGGAGLSKLPAGAKVTR